MPQLNQRNQDSSSVIMLGVLLAACILRTWNPWVYTFSGDEMLFLLIAKGDTLGEVWRRGLMELHPPLAHFIRHYWLWLTPSDAAQRLLSIAAGMVSILGMYRFGTLMHSRTMGIFCALSMTFLPIAVVTSMAIRNYALFMAFATWALCFFLRYTKDHAPRHLAAYTLLILLASTTHFTGFFVAAICGIHEGVRQLHTKQWKPLFLFCASYLPLAALALFFYLHFMAPNTAGPMWETLSVLTGGLPAGGGSLFQRAMILYSQFLSPLLPFMQLQTVVGTSAMQLTLMCLSCWLFLMYLFALVHTYQQDRRAFYLVITAWSLAAFTTFTNLYPIAIGRHAFYFFPFFILPYGYLLHAPLARLQHSRRFVPAVIAVSLLLAATHFYTYENDEFGLKRTDLADAITYLNDHLTEGDAIVTGRFAASFYLLNAYDNGAGGYDHFATTPYVKNTRILAPFNPPWKAHTTWQPFYDTLRAQSATLPTSANLWFVALDYQNVEHEHLAHCNAAAPMIEHFFSRDGVMIFSINVRRFRQLLAAPSIWEQCFQGYKPSITATSFKQEPWPAATP